MKNILLSIALLSMLGCSATKEPIIPDGAEVHELEIKVIYATYDQIDEIWKKLAPESDERQRVGLFDFNTNSLYCVKWDFDTCGHELHHITQGEDSGNHEGWPYETQCLACKRPPHQ